MLSKSDKKKRQRRRGRKPKSNTGYDYGEESGEYDPADEMPEYHTQSN